MPPEAAELLLPESVAMPAECLRTSNMRRANACSHRRCYHDAVAFLLHSC